ncbi:MAG: L-arabinose isomerase family protein [Candidatus Bathyarchaeota archaeon]
MFKKPNVLVIPTISPLHEEKRILTILLRLKELLEKEVNITLEKFIRDLSQVSRLKIDEEKFDAIVVFVGSGGTAEIIKKLIMNKKWILLAYSENNSLPSALTAKEKLVAVNKWRSHLFYIDVEKMEENLKKVTRVVHVLWKIKNLKLATVGFIGSNKDLNRKNFVRKFFGTNVKTLSLKKLEGRLGEVVEKEVDSLISRFKDCFEVVEPSQEDIKNSCKLYLALKHIMKTENLSCITLDCFSLLKKLNITPCLAFSLLIDEDLQGVCEGDILHVPLMLLLPKLTGKPCWLANLSKVNLEDKTLTFAHCTAATKLSDGGKVKLRSHFETGLSVALEVQLKNGPLTIIHVVRKPPSLVVGVGEAIKKESQSENLCRTQVSLKFNGDLKRFLETTGNHHVLCYGDLTPELEIVSNATGLRLVKA